ncbi:MAG: cyclase family protein [bacterium]|nr:cyclase family protein [bacterium]
MKYVDLSHTFDVNTPVYPGDAPPTFLQLAENSKDGFMITQLTHNTHTGTHIDAPLHMIENGKNIHDYPISYFFGEAVVIKAKDKKIIDIDSLEGVILLENDLVIIETGKYKEYGESSYFENSPEISVQFAKALVNAKVRMLCIDFASPDSAPFLVHKELLSNDILIIENLNNLEALGESARFKIVALPGPYATDASPVRVVAIVD